MNSPLVSVVIPAHQAEGFVREAILSAAAQTHPRIEIVVVDDGSTDGTWHAIATAGTDVRAIRTAHRGAPAARNVGLEVARGDYVQFLDADDLLLPPKIARQVEFMEVAEVELSHGAYEALYVRKGESQVRPGIGPTDDLVGDLLGNFAFSALHSYLYRRETILAVGGWAEAVSYQDDRLFNLKMAITARKTAYLPGAHAVWRHYAAFSMSRSFYKSKQAALSSLGDLRRIDMTAKDLLIARGAMTASYEAILAKRGREIEDWVAAIEDFPDYDAVSVKTLPTEHVLMLHHCMNRL